jgi:HEAT repeat protein
VSIWGTTPRQSVEAECARRGTSSVVDGCIALVLGIGADDDLMVALAGPAATEVLRGREGGVEGHWPRVWGARGLLYAWEDRAASAVVRAADDDAWRVREMALKVIARHVLDDGVEAAARRLDDPVPRVRRAAERALARVARAG